MYPKKLIEVALPLEAINKEAAREKSIRYGHPSTLHLWWARRPLAACRAVLFSSLVDDPSEYIEDEEKQKQERVRLFQLIEQLVKWENINNEEVLDKAKLEIARSVSRNLGLEMPVGKQAIEEFLVTKVPPVLDPFAGGGSIPLEAQRLGLRAFASDLNPVSVLINKALIEIPPKFSDMPPVHPPEKKAKGDMEDMFAGKLWKGAEGLAEDVRYYGQWMRDEAEKKIGHLYPKIKIIQEILDERDDLKQQGLKVGDELNAVAWLWARTVICPNPACGKGLLLMKSFWLSRKKGKEAWLEYDNQSVDGNISFKIRKGIPSDIELIKGGTVDRRGARCLHCGAPTGLDYVRFEAKSKRMTYQLIGIVAKTSLGREYFSPIEEHVNRSKVAQPIWLPDQEIPVGLGVSIQNYGLLSFDMLFTNRQLVALNTYIELLDKTWQTINEEIKNGERPSEYADAIITYLALAISRLSDINNSLCMWENTRTQVRHLFTRQAIPIIWDFAEPNHFGNAAGDFNISLASIIRVLKNLRSYIPGSVFQEDANLIHLESDAIISTDPPYYDNIEYSSISNFFYVWLRKSLKKIYPKLFSTMLTPRSSELVASKHKFDGDQEKAKVFFENGLKTVFGNLQSFTNLLFPTTVYYAFKQTEIIADDMASTGWETMIEGLLANNYAIIGTWPLRTELSNRMRGQNSNALATSIVLVCRKRIGDAPKITRREFISRLRKSLPDAIGVLKQGNIAPVDLAQASIGPGMAIYSETDGVLEADGSLMNVRSALSLINKMLDEVYSEQEGDYDSDTRWAVSWYEQYGHDQTDFGIAETLSKAKNTSVDGLVQAGILESRAGKVRLLKRKELILGWSPEEDKRLTTWEATQYLIRALEKDGEQVAAELLAKLGTAGEPARDLAYQLYTICERKSWAQDALGYNMLVVAWPHLKELAGKTMRQQDHLL